MLKKDSKKLLKKNKLVLQAFINYLIDYNCTNIYCIQNPIIYDIKGYRDIIFNKNSIYNLAEN